MRRIVLPIALLLALVPAPAALARGGGSTVIRDCTDDGRLEGHYTQAQLKAALDSIPSDVDEYTNCRQVIQSAYEAGGSGRSGGGSSGGGAFGGFGGSPPPPGTDPLTGATPAERAAVAAASTKDGPVDLGDGQALVRPGALGHGGSGTGDVPTSLLVAAALLALAAAAAAGPTLRRRVLARRAA